MSDPCGPEPLDPPDLDAAPVLAPARGGTRLVTDPDRRSTPSLRRDCDAVTALKRGLREYLEQCSVEVWGERVRFETVTDVWADPEDQSAYPGCSVQTSGEARYDGGRLTPKLVPVAVGPELATDEGRRSYLVRYSEVAVSLVIELHTSAPEQRIACAMLLEDALNPVEWMSGFQLELPHYFNQRGVFEPVTSQMGDNMDDARRHYRPGSVILTGQIPMVRARSLPLLRPRLDLTVTEGGDS